MKMKTRSVGLNLFFLSLFSVVSVVLTSCSFSKPPLGDSKNPVKFFFLPSVDTKVIDSSTSELKKYLEEHTPYKFSIHVPASYIAVVEAFGSKQADVAVFTAFPYLLAHDKYKAEARLIVKRHGSTTYQGQFIARTDSPIQGLKDLEGKKIAFVDPSSTTGYLFPQKMLKDAGVKIGESVFAMKHDNVVSMVYQKQVDAGTTFYSEEENGEIQDARRLVKGQFPDVEQKVKIFLKTDPIPNDAFAFRVDMPEEMKQKITQVLLDFVHTESGRDALKRIYGITDLAPVQDSEYDGLRKVLKELGQDAESVLSKAPVKK